MSVIFPYAITTQQTFRLRLRSDMVSMGLASLCNVGDPIELRAEKVRKVALKILKYVEEGSVLYFTLAKLWKISPKDVCEVAENVANDVLLNKF